MGFGENNVNGEKSDGEPLSRQVSESSIYATDHEEEDEVSKIQLGPQCTLKEHLEKDKVSMHVICLSSYLTFSCKVMLISYFILSFLLLLLNSVIVIG